MYGRRWVYREGLRLAELWYLDFAEQEYKFSVVDLLPMRKSPRCNDKDGQKLKFGKELTCRESGEKASRKRAGF